MPLVQLILLVFALYHPFFALVLVLLVLAGSVSLAEHLCKPRARGARRHW